MRRWLLGAAAAPAFAAQAAQAQTNHVFRMATSVGAAATWNAGGHSNPAFDALPPRIHAEQDPERRRAPIREAQVLHNAEYGHIPLYHMMIPWAHRTGVTIAHRADNQVQLREIRMD